MNIALLLIFNHWIADFVMQTDEMATNKSKSNFWLLKHICAYTSCLAFIVGYAAIKFSPISALVWMVLNGCLHFVTDYFTSRWTSRLWQQGERHWFFVVIGLDQVIHYACLFLTWQLIFI